MSRKIVEEVIGIRDTKELWGTGYWSALPITPQHFSLGSVLPAVFYMMRWGHRRGKGKFAEAFGKKSGSGEVASVWNVATHLSEEETFDGFDGNVQKSILSDLLLAYCLENKNHKPGRNDQVQRVFPTHYFSSWVDLPANPAHMRGVPELIVVALERQSDGSTLSKNKSGGYYSIASGFEKNLLLSLFGSGTSIGGQENNVRIDEFNEESPVGIDQLLAIRIARDGLREAPTKLRGEPPEIKNQQPVAQLAFEQLYEDFDVFLRAYGQHIPRQSLLAMLESCLSVGISNIFFSAINLILQWSGTGVVKPKKEQTPWPLFIDCSSSIDSGLRRFSEESLDDLMRRFYRLSVCMMCLRILDQRERQEKLKAPNPGPDPTARINFLGDLLFGRLSESRDIERDLRRTCNKLLEALENEENVQVKQVLNDDERWPAWRLAEALVLLMGDSVQSVQFRKCLDSSLMMDQPNGIGRKRRTIIKGKWIERRSMVLTNTALDFLVHRHLRKPKKGTGPADISLSDFIIILRDRYGFYIDEAPPGLSIPTDGLRKNRAHLERRLRDLGLRARLPGSAYQGH